MIGIRTPVKPSKTSLSTLNKSQNVRKSIGEWESGMSGPDLVTPKKTTQAKTYKSKQTTPRSVSEISYPTTSQEQNAKPQGGPLTDKEAEAKAHLSRAKLCLADARNLRIDIKTVVTKALECLFQIIVELEQARKEEKAIEKGKLGNPEKQINERTVLLKMENKIEENNRLLYENIKRLDIIKEQIEKTQMGANTTYSNVTANLPKRIQEKALHSVIITSKHESDTGEEILSQVREAVNAKEGWVRVEKVRRAKDRKIIMGCTTKEDRRKIKERIESKNSHLIVEEARNKDPLLILRDVFSINSDEDVISAFRNQNKDLFQGLSEEESRIQIKYRKKARNPHASHVIVCTSPVLWSRATEAGSLLIDLQRVKVFDQTPLVQCTKCLGYGHGRKLCKELSDICSHCSGPHHCKDCPEKIIGAPPMCRNCCRAGIAEMHHNTFSSGCPVRQKWDTIARSTIAYC